MNGDIAFYFFLGWLMGMGNVSVILVLLYSRDKKGASSSRIKEDAEK